jgi:uncharacterized protein
MPFAKACPPEYDSIMWSKYFYSIFVRMNTFYNNSSFRLKIAESQIPNAGLGVYTLEDIPAGTRIDEYCGHIQDHGGNYALQIKKNYFINADVWPRPYMGIINDCSFIATKYKKKKGRRIDITPGAYYDSHGNILRTNCEFRVCEIACKGWVYASHDIRAGSELFVEYGDEYWK